MSNFSNPNGKMDGTPADFFKFQNVSPEMLNLGMHAGQDLLMKQRERWMPGISGFWSSLKIYFAVSNEFVLKKLAIVVYPISNKNWFRIPADESQQQADSNTHKWALPREDVNAPDLYIPLMSFISYVLLSGLSKGIGGSGFTPEILITSIWRCLILQLCESVVIRFGLSMMGVALSFLDIFSYTGYKYVGLCLSTVARVFGSTFHALCSFYSSCMLAHFILRSFAAVVPGKTEIGPPRHLMLLGFAALQFIVILILCWL